MTASLQLHRVDDATALEALACRVYQDPANRAATGWRQLEDKQEAIEALVGLWHRRAADGWHIFEVRWDGQGVGLAGLGPVHDPEQPPGLGIYLTERGHGIGTEVGRRLLDLARERGARRVRTVALDENEASGRMLAKLRFEPVGPCTEDWALQDKGDWTIHEAPLDKAPLGKTDDALM